MSKLDDIRAAIIDRMESAIAASRAADQEVTLANTELEAHDRAVAMDNDHVGLPVRVRDGFVVGVVGRNQHRKRLDLAIAYFAEWVQTRRIADAYLLIQAHGEGSRAAHLKFEKASVKFDLGTAFVPDVGGTEGKAGVIRTGGGRPFAELTVTILPDVDAA